MSSSFLLIVFKNTHTLPEVKQLTHFKTPLIVLGILTLLYNGSPELFHLTELELYTPEHCCTMDLQNLFISQNWNSIPLNIVVQWISRTPELFHLTKLERYTPEQQLPISPSLSPLKPLLPVSVNLTVLEISSNGIIQNLSLCDRLISVIIISSRLIHAIHVTSFSSSLKLNNIPL